MKISSFCAFHSKIKVDTISNVLKSSITDLKSLSSSSIAVIPPDSVPSSPQLPTKTRSFDDRECLRSASEADDGGGGASIDAISVHGIDDSKCDESQEQRKSSENISVKCEINEPNANVRQENNTAVLSNASDTNLEASSLLSDGAKVKSESFSVSASPPRITVMCAPCIDDILAESAAQQAEKIDCDVSDSEENAQNTKTDDSSVQCSNETDARKQSIQMTPSNLQLSLEVKKSDEITVQQEDLSPSMDEYEECNPTSGDYQYDTIVGETLAPGCVAPAPTPAPLIAPLAEIEIDPPDDEMPVSGIDKPPEISIEPAEHTTDAESTAKPQLQQQQSQTSSRTKKKKQKSTGKGAANANGNPHSIFLFSLSLYFNALFALQWQINLMLVFDLQVTVYKRNPAKTVVATRFVLGKMSKSFFDFQFCVFVLFFFPLCLLFN